MSLFYEKPASKVLFRKKERDALWKIVARGGTPRNLQDIIGKCPAIAHQIAKANDQVQNLQAGVLSECVYAQTLANIFGLLRFHACEDCDCFLPDCLTKLLSECQLNPRYIYFNDDSSVMLIQAGYCGGVDSALLLVKDLAIYPIEFKEPYAKSSEPDLPKFGEDGNLVVDAEFASDYPQFIPMLNEHKDLNFWELAGHNEHRFSYSSINIAITRNYTYSDKYAHVICTEDRNGYLAMLPVNDASEWANIEGEIRSTGRNPNVVWTPARLNSVLLAKGASIEQGIVTMPAKELIEKRQRGGGGKPSSKLKIDTTFVVPRKCCKLCCGRVSFPISAVRQLRPTITAKMNFKKLSVFAVRDYYFPQHGKTV